ncbi:MAG: endopeptidase La, partial [Gammaproteobacteria bacterium]
MIDEIRVEGIDAGSSNQDKSPVKSDAEESARAAGDETADNVIIIIPVRNVVMFPGVVLPISITRKASIAGAQEAVRQDRKIGLLLQKDATVEVPEPDDLYRVGTTATLMRYITTEDGTHHLICQGEDRFKVRDFIAGQEYLEARVEIIKENEPETVEVEARLHYMKDQAGKALSMLPRVPAEMISALQNITSAAVMADVISNFLELKATEKQELLETFDISQRLDKVVNYLGHQVEIMRLSQKIDEQTRESMDARQREIILREQLKTIQKELGEGQGGTRIAELEQAITKANMPEEAEQQARKELQRLQSMPESSTEYSMVETYLDWLTALPWSLVDNEEIDIGKARLILDEDHYGLDKVKKRILEYLAVRKLNPEGHSPILCFVGPPGVGKTSLGKSIARALGLQFIRVSLGGVHDEAQVRGHRRTYIGALPGEIIQAIRKAGKRNPVFMLDEIDKLGTRGFQGDPSSALLEVLDPAQNNNFRDNYLALPFDLSRVFFIGTANVLYSIPGPLLDRMEVIEIPGYTQEEKSQIALRYLIDRQLKDNGLSADQVSIPEQTINTIISDYTREAGCRNLEREIGAVMRNVAVKILEGHTGKIIIEPEQLHGILGPRRFESETALRTSVPGVATGLAWTPVGGDILFVESSKSPGNGKLILTGQLGDVMKESAQAALSLIKSRMDQFGLAPEIFSDNDIHVHVPAGAIPKDGPSAGVAIFISLVSLLTDRQVSSDVAMTGEISLRGLVLPIGGIKEKSLAA